MKDSMGTKSYAEVCKNLAVLFELGTGEYKKAEPLFLEAMQIIEKLEGKTSLKYAESCNDLGSFYYSSGQFQKSEPLLLEAKKIREQIVGKDHQDYAASCNDLGLLYLANGKYEQAEALFLEARQIWGKTLGIKHTNYAKSCNNLSLLYAQTNQLDKAEKFIIEARQIFFNVSGKTDPNYAGSCINLAHLYLMRNQFEKAEPLLIEAMEIVEHTSGKQHINFARSCMNLAEVYLQMGQPVKAEPLLITAKTIIEEAYGNQHIGYVEVCRRLAQVYLAMGRYGNAELLMLEARQILFKIRGNGHADYARSCESLAALYRVIGQFQKAETLALEAKQIDEKVFGKDHLSYGRSCESLGAVYESTGQLEKAEALFLEAQRTVLKISGKENRDYANSCNGLASLYRRMQHYDKAEALFLEAKRIWENVEGNNDPQYSAIIHNLGRLYQKMGEYRKAEPLLLEAKDLREKMLGRQHMSYMASCSRLGNLYWNITEYEKAASLYTEAYEIQSGLIGQAFEFTSEIEKEQFINEIANFDPFYLSFLTTVYPHSSGGIAYDVSLFSRNLILNSSRQLRDLLNTSSDTAIKTNYNKWIYLKKRLSFWYAKPVVQRPAYVNEFEVEANNLEKELTLISASFKEKYEKKKISWRDVRQSLKVNEAAIEFVKFKYFNGYQMTDSIVYFAVMIKKDLPEPELIPLFEGRQLSTILGGGNTRNTVAAIYRDNRSFAAYGLIWAPLEKYLQNISKIYFAPAGELYRICFAAIPVNSSQVLSDKYELVQLNTTASIVNLQDLYVARTDNILLFGGIQYDADSASLRKATAAFHDNRNESRAALFTYSDETRGDTWKNLPGTEKEIKSIERIGTQKNYSITSSLSVTATEEKFKELSDDTVSVLHIATHGFFFPDKKGNYENEGYSETEKILRESDNPLLRCGLLFAGANHAWKGRPIEGIENGILTAYEISNLSLPHTKLVVLSACETGLGDIRGNEGVYGLQRAFKIAGVENLIMSLWKVPDIETTEFMQEFYKNVFERQSVNRAFYNAQSKMKNKYRKDPYKWAAWILVR